MMSHTQVSPSEGKECFYTEEKEVGMAVINKSPWLFTGCVFASKEETFFFLLGSAIVPG